MLVLRVEYLTGVCMATKHDDPTRSTPEWPPHPDRLYSALVAAAAEPEPSGGTWLPDSERKALEWLAEQGDPEIHASPAHPRTTPAVPMPSNPHEDEIWQKSNPRAVKADFDPKTWAPIHRKKVMLPIPAVVPEEAVVWFIWSNAEPDGRRETLRSICGRVTCLGRSRSLVHVTVEGQAPATTYIPDPLGDLQFRVPPDDRLGYLVDKYQRDGGKPEPSPLRRYRLANTAPSDSSSERQHSIFNRFWVFQSAAGDPVLPVEATLRATRALRAAVLRQLHEMTCGCSHWTSWEHREKRIPSCGEARECYAKIPSPLSGHAQDGNPLNAPHLTFVSLPFVHPVQRHADGTIKGLAVLIPRDLDGDLSVLKLLAQALERLEASGLPIPGIGRWRLKEAPANIQPLLTLDRRTWTKPSRNWTTATPVIFGHFPKWKNGGEAKVVLDALRIAGIDATSVIEIATAEHASLYGVPSIWHFRPHREQAHAARPRRWMRHVTLRFSRPISGPLTIGALRYFGMGLMRPMESSSA